MKFRGEENIKRSRSRAEKYSRGSAVVDIEGKQNGAVDRWRCRWRWRCEDHDMGPQGNPIGSFPHWCVGYPTIFHLSAITNRCSACYKYDIQENYLTWGVNKICFLISREPRIKQSLWLR